MADSTKKEKIAAAKKRLKQFQQKAGRTASPSPARASARGVPERDCASNSSHSNNSDREEPLTNSAPHTTLQGTDSRANNSDQTAGSHADRIDRAGLSVTQAGTGLANESRKSLDIWVTPAAPRTTSSTESLQQLSRHLNGLLAESADVINGDDVENSGVVELEKRNRELAALLEKHTEANEQLHTQIHQIREYAASLQTQKEQEREAFEEKLKKDVGSLKEQLQVHIQTIGILVAEKTELQSQLSQAQRIGEQRFEEIEELSGRLKASRQRLADLERNLASVSQSSEQFEKSSRENAKEVDRLKLELYKLNKSKDEMSQQNAEFTAKLKSKVSENSSLEETVTDLQKQLEMAELYAKQLSSESDSSETTMKMLEDLRQERDNAQALVRQKEEALREVVSNRDQVVEHYQQFISQLQQQTKELSQQTTSLTEERDRLLMLQHEAESAVTELQSKLEFLAAEKSAVTTEKETVPSEKLQELENALLELRDLQARHEAQIRDNAQLSRFLEEKEERIMELERSVAELGEEAGDRTSLLETVQSDKTALSRALAQNKELKVQLAELQNGFVKMSNDNMELTTQLQTDQHASQELAAKLAVQEDELTQLRAQMVDRDRNLEQLQKTVQASQREEFQQDQIQDRLRHYEAQAQLVEALQNELHSAQDMMEALTTQNKELRTMLIKATAVTENEDGSNPDRAAQRDEVMESLTGRIQQLEADKVQLSESLRDQRQLSDNLGIKVADLQEEVIRKSAKTEYLDSDKISRAEFENLRSAMEMIQEKYMSVMRDKAELSDKAEQLEHLVLQLQGETDTIGEYISLYHHQRALLQQRELQKNEYIAQLAKDREEMQGKLGQLQGLVMQLLGEKKMLHSYHQESGQATAPEGQAIQPHLAAAHQHLHLHPHHQHHHKQQNGLEPTANDDWPDYTSSESDNDSEVEPIVGGEELPDSPTPTHASPASSLPDSSPYMSPPTSDSIQPDTANRILNLLSEIGTSNLVEKIPILERNFHPCKFCSGQLQIV